MAVLKKKTQAVQKIVKKTPSAKPVTGSRSSNAGGKDYIPTVGRRKSAVARVRIFVGSGDNTINGKSVSAYFPQETLQETLFRPLVVLSKRDSIHFTVKVLGGGIHGQADAIAHGLARALVKADESNKKPLRDSGLLTRDPRMRETRKMGTGGKARRAKQSPKR